MPKVVFYKKSNGRKPVMDWLATLPKLALIKVAAKINRLKELGNDLRRPDADYLDKGIYELRAVHLGIHYRLLYFFDGKEIVVLAHAIIKKTKKVRRADIEKAVKRKEEHLSKNQ